jgi:hypothetical protein
MDNPRSYNYVCSAHPVDLRSTVRTVTVSSPPRGDRQARNELNRRYQRAQPGFRLPPSKILPNTAHRERKTSRPPDSGRREPNGDQPRESTLPLNAAPISTGKTMLDRRRSPRECFSEEDLLLIAKTPLQSQDERGLQLALALGTCFLHLAS